MDRIRVIHVWKDLDTYYGVHDQILTLGRHLDRAEFDFSVAVFDRRENEISRRFREAHIPVLDMGLPGKQNPLNVIGFARFLRRQRPHILHTYCLNTNIFGVLSGRVARVPVIIPTELTQKDQAPTALRRLRDKLLNPAKNQLSRLASCELFVSQNVKENWVGTGRDRHCRVIYPPFSFEKYQPFERTPIRFPRRRGRFTVGVVARLSEEKRHVDLFEAIAKLRDTLNVHLVAVGTGPVEQTLRQRVLELGIADRVTFTGYRSNVFEELQHFDLFVLPSRSEGLPISIVEAMAMGLPVVATRVGGIPEAVIDGRTGILVPPLDPDALSRAILDIAQNADAAETMGRLARDRALRLFHPDEFAHRHAALYRELLLAERPDLFV